MFIGIAVWNLMDGLSFWVQDDTLKIIFHEMKMLGPILVPAFLFIFISDILKIDTKQYKYQVIMPILFVVPVVSIISVMTNYIHHGFRKAIWVEQFENVKLVIVENGWVFWLNTWHSYLIVFAIVIMLLRSLKIGNKVERLRALLIMIAMLIPIIINMVFTFELTFRHIADYTSVGFSFGLIFLLFAMKSYRIFEVENITRNHIFEFMDIGIIVLDKFERIADINACARRIFRWKIKKVYGRLFWELVDDFTKDELNKGKPEILLDKEGKKYNVEAKLLLNKDGSERGEIIFISDVTAREKMKEKIKYINLHDALTGLYNRHYYNAIIEKLDTEENLPLGIVVGDLNGLKIINDGFGHAEGDKALVEIAGILSDAISDDDVAFRFGGDEFLIICAKTSEGYLDRLCSIINRACIGKKRLSISLGYSIKNLNDENLEEKILLADNVMYKKKLMLSKHFHTKMVDMIIEELEDSMRLTKVHLQKRESLCLEFGKWIGLSKHRVEDLMLMSKVCDIGKACVSEECSSENECSADVCVALTENHAIKSYNILSSIPEYSNVAEVVLYHHEKWDGSGAPFGASGYEIPYLARILSLTDNYIYMTCDGMECDMNKGLSQFEAIGELENKAGNDFDPLLTEQFIDYIRSKQNDRNEQII